MYSSEHSIYYEPLSSAQLFPTHSTNPSDPFSTASFDHAFFPRGPERQQSIPYPSSFPSDLPALDVDGSIFDAEVVDSEFAVAPLSPSSSSTSDGSSNSFASHSSSSSSSCSSAASPPPPPDADAQYAGDDSPFQLPASAYTSDPQPEPPTLTPSLLASLSFDPQQLLAQLTTNLLTTPTTTTQQPKRRNRIPGLTAQQRAALKRQKHREIDTQRRHREQAAIGKLHSLVYQVDGRERRGGGGRKRMKGEWVDGEERGGEEEEDEDGGEEDEGGEDDDSTKKDKVTILEHSAKRLEQMQAIIHQLATACSTQQQNNRLLLSQLQHSNHHHQLPPPPSSSSSSHALSLFREPVAQQLDAQLGSQSLYASLFLSASTPIFLIRCETGQIVDVNSRMLAESGWSRHHLINRLMTAPYDVLIHTPHIDVDAAMRAAGNRVLVEADDGTMVEAQKQSQYERSTQLAKQLYLGERQQIEAVWRAQMRNGKVYEVACTSWVSGYREVRGSGGRVVRMPDTVVFACDTMNAVCISGE